MTDDTTKADEHETADDGKVVRLSDLKTVPLHIRVTDDEIALQE
jgi:hypothetical protein